MLKSLLGRLSSTTGGGAAQRAAAAPDSPSGEAAGQLMIGKQTYRQHALEAATPFRGAPPTDYRKAGSLPQGGWMEPKGPASKPLAAITGSSANSTATSHPRATGALACTDGGDEPMRRMSLSSAVGAPTGAGPFHCPFRGE